MLTMPRRFILYDIRHYGSCIDGHYSNRCGFTNTMCRRKILYGYRRTKFSDMSELSRWNYMRRYWYFRTHTVSCGYVVVANRK